MCSSSSGSGVPYFEDTSGQDSKLILNAYRNVHSVQLLKGDVTRSSTTDDMSCRIQHSLDVFYWWTLATWPP